MQRAMIRTERKTEPSWIDVEVVLDRSFVNNDGLDILQELVATAAPTWISKLRIWRSSRDQRPVDPAKPGALRNAVLAAAVNDPAFLADAMREKIEVDPVAGAEVETIIRNAYAAPPEVRTRLIEAMKPPR